MKKRGRWIALMSLLVMVIVITVVASPSVVHGARYGMTWTDTGYEKEFDYYYSASNRDNYITTTGISKLTIEGNVAFCIQAGKAIEGWTSASSGSTNPSYNKVVLDIAERNSKANKVAYLGYYANSQTDKNYAYTQMYLYETFNYVLPSGNATARFTTASVRADYANWKKEIDAKLARWVITPSFNYINNPYPVIDVERGESLTLTDTNNALADYGSFEYTKSGITVKHTKGNNTLDVKVSNDVSVSDVFMIPMELRSAGCEKWSSNIKMNYSYSSSNNQDLRVFGATDPLDLSLRFNVAMQPIKIEKIDENGNPVKLAGTEFRVENEDKSFSKVYTTDASGIVTTEKLGIGKYTITEVKAPTGYVISNEVKEVNVVASDTPLSIKYENKNQMGIINIDKKVKATDGAGKEHIEQLEGAVFNVVAREDITTPNGTLLHKKGDVVDTVTTDANGKASSKELYLGAYQVKEVSVPTGFVLTNVVTDVDLTYTNQNEDVIYKAITIYNQHQMGIINIDKKVKATDGAGKEHIEQLEGAVFNVVAREDITTPNGTLLHKKGDVVDTVTTDANGKASSKELYLGAYQVKEVSVPTGFVLTNVVTDVDLTYTNQNEDVIYKAITIYNQHQMGIINIDKKGYFTQDLEKEVEALAYVKFDIVANKDISTPNGTILYKKDDVVDTIITGEDGKASSKELYLGAYDVIEKEYLAMKTTFSFTEKDIDEVMALYQKNKGIGEIEDLRNTLKTKTISEINDWYYYDGEWLSDEILKQSIKEYVEKNPSTKKQKELVADKDNKYEFPKNPIIQTIELKYAGQDVDVVYENSLVANHAQKGWAKFFTTTFNLGEENSSAPNTGDDNLYMPIILSGIALILASIIIFRKRKISQIGKHFK